MGRPAGTKNIKSEEELWSLFDEYAKYIKSTPIKKMVFVGKDGGKEMEERERPLTMEGFECYLYEKGIIGDLSHYFCNLEGRYSDFVAVCTRIRKSIKADQIEGGMAGIYNPSITQRLNNLKETTETNVTANVSILSIDPLDDSADNRTS